MLSEPGVKFHFQPKRLSDLPDYKTAKLNNRGRSFVHLCEEFWENKRNAKNDNVCGECRSQCLSPFKHTPKERATHSSCKVDQDCELIELTTH